jgi:3-hydroxyisobutyrate dehydrogenase
MRVAFIGLGNMGAPMARNLIKSGHEVTGFDVAGTNLAGLVAAGGTAAPSLAAAAAGAEAVITMLPAGKQVRDVYFGADGLVARCAPGTLLVDCSTIDVATAREVEAASRLAGHEFIDAPVSGGTGGAEAGTLTFMCGGADVAFARAQGLLSGMGRTIVHAGGPGTGQAAKICNNMILGVSMIAVGEAFNLADALGLDADKLFEIASKSSGQCWSLTSYCPVPGPVPASPANRDYAPGFTGAMMLKDLKLAQEAAHGAGVSTPLGAVAQTLFALYARGGHASDDFSGIIRLLAGQGAPRQQ